MSGKWNAFKSLIVRDQDMYIAIRIKGKSGRSQEHEMMREIDALVRKKESWVRYR